MTLSRSSTVAVRAPDTKIGGSILTAICRYILMSDAGFESATPAAHGSFDDNRHLIGVSLERDQYKSFG